jgi:hypothetical protein
VQATGSIVCVTDYAIPLRVLFNSGLNNFGHEEIKSGMPMLLPALVSVPFLVSRKRNLSEVEFRGATLPSNRKLDQWNMYAVT